MSSRKQRGLACTALGSTLLFVAMGVHAAPTGPQVIAGPSALPSGGVVAHGQATLNQQGNVLTVTNSPGAIINWQSFAIGSASTTNFVQQSASSAVLNRVVGQNISTISGQLLSNGRVFLTNPNGVLITSGAVINAASFTASTSAISNADFLAGNTQWGGEGSVLSTNGVLTVAGGALAVSPSSIVITGTVEMAGTGNLSLLTAGTQTIDHLVMNGGLLTVEANAAGVIGPGRLVTNWSDFQIDPGAAGTFVLSSGGAVLNRVGGQNISLISGTVSGPTDNISLRGPNSLSTFTSRLRAVSALRTGVITMGGSTIQANAGNLQLPGGTITLTSSAAPSGATITLQKREPQF